MATISSNYSKWCGRIWRYAPLFIWIAVILYASSSEASMVETSRFIRPLLEWLFPNAAPENLTLFHIYIRKSAHIFEYSVLAFLAAHAFCSSSLTALRRHWFFAALVLVMIIGSIDEFRQGFAAARTSLFSDVVLDVFGGLIALTSLVIHRRYWTGVTRNN